MTCFVPASGGVMDSTSSAVATGDPSPPVSSASSVLPPATTYHGHQQQHCPSSSPHCPPSPYHHHHHQDYYGASRLAPAGGDQQSSLPEPQVRNTSQIVFAMTKTATGFFFLLAPFPPFLYYSSSPSPFPPFPCCLGKLHQIHTWHSLGIPPNFTRCARRCAKRGLFLFLLLSLPHLCKGAERVLTGSPSASLYLEATCLPQLKLMRYSIEHQLRRAAAHTVVILSCFKHADSPSVKYSPRIREEHQKPPFCLLSRLA